MKSIRHIVEPVIGLLILLGLVGGLTWYLQEPEVEFIQGEVDATQVNLAVKIAGRVSEVFVKEGQSVPKGASLLKLDSPEINARLQQAASSEKAASAQRDKAYSGRRQEPGSSRGHESMDTDPGGRGTGRENLPEDQQPVC